METRAILLIFSFELEISGVALQGIYQRQKIAAFSENFYSGDEFEAVSTVFCSYEYGANASAIVEKIATDEKIITNAPCTL